jgi:hypothetical protein
MGLAWAVVGVCLTQTVNFNRWAEVVVGRAEYASSHQRRFGNWFKNKPIKFFWPLLRAAMQLWPPEQVLYLALDSSDLKNGYILIRLALVYRGGAIAVAWRVLKHNSTSVSYQQYKSVLHQAVLILPKGQAVVLLADRGFVHARLVKFCRQHHWGYHLRAKSTTRVRLPDRHVTSFDQLCPAQGHARYYQQVHILGEKIGPVNIALAHPTDGEEPWYIISDAPTASTTLDEYALRFDIEEAFNTVKRLLGLAYLWTGSLNGVLLQLWATWLFYAILVDLGDAVADEIGVPFDRISLEMLYRGLYHFTQARSKGKATDPVTYFAAPENQDLGVVKVLRKPPIKLDLSPYPI